MNDQPDPAVVAEYRQLTHAAYRHPKHKKPTVYHVDDRVKLNAEWKRLVKEYPALKGTPCKAYKITALHELSYDLPDGTVRSIVAVLEGGEEFALKFLRHAKPPPRQPTTINGSEQTREDTCGHAEPPCIPETLEAVILQLLL